MNKPTKPINNLPNSFGGIKDPFTNGKIESGYEPNVPDILGGANLNYLLDTLGQRQVYYDTIVDFIKDLPIGKTITVNSNNELVYANNLDFAARHIGEIVTSTIPLTDAGLHLLDGALISGSGSYSAFVDYIAGLVSDYPNLFITEASWQTAVTTYGVCGKFVYDSINNTVRLPKITRFIEGASDVSDVGNITEAGIPNLQGWFQGAGQSATNCDQVLFTRRGAGVEVSNSGERDNTYNFNAQNYNSIYGNSRTVQPQSVKVLYYIVIATSTKTEIEVDIDEIATDLNGKVDVDLTNVNDSGTSTGASWAMPSDTYDELTIGASGTTYTAPANGWFYAHGTGSANTNYHSITFFYNSNLDWTTPAVSSGNNSSSASLALMIPVKKEQIVRMEYGNITMNNMLFIYAQGSESEAS